MQTSSLTNLPIAPLQDNGVAVVEGMQFPRGYLSSYFINNPESGSVEFENSYVLLYENQISNVREVFSLLEKITEADKPLIIIAGDVLGDPLSIMTTQSMRGIVKVVAVKAHGFGDNRKSILQDIAILTGGKMISVESGLPLCDVTLDDFGQAKHIRVTKNTTTIIGGAGIPADINARIDQVRSQIDAALSEYDRENLQKRVANLVDGLAVTNIMQASSLTNVAIAPPQDNGVAVVEGMQFPRGYLSPYFINNPESQSVEFEDSYVLLYENQVSNSLELIPLLEKITEADKPLIIIAGDVLGDPLSLMVTQIMRGIVKVVAVKAHGFGDNRKSILQDIAILTGGTMISVESGLSLCDVTLDNFGQAKHIRVTQDTTTIIGGAGIPADINARIDQVRSQIDAALSEYDRELLQQRVANLVDGLTVANY